MDDVRKRVGEVLTDYRDGLLDSLDEAVDAILDIPEIRDRMAMQVVKVLDAPPRAGSGNADS